MANRDVIRISWGGPDFAAIEYNDANLAIRRIYVSLSSGRIVRALVWDTLAGGIPSDPATALIDQTFIGPTAQEFNVPGNRRLIERTDEHGTYPDLPDNLIYQFYMNNQDA